MKIGNHRQLYWMLKVFGIEEPRSEEIWNSISKPIALKRVRHQYEMTLREIRRNNIVARLEKVWQLSNLRACLWNTWHLEIAAPGNPRYRYLDEGFHEFKDLIIRSTAISKADMAALASMDASYFFRDSVVSATMDEIHGHLNTPWRDFNESENRKNMESIVKRLESMEPSMKIGRHFIRRGSLRYGVEGVELASYFSFERMLRHDFRFAGMKAVLESLGEGACELKGEQKLWLGAFCVTIRKSDAVLWGSGGLKVNGILVDGICLDRNSVVHAVRESQGFRDGRRFQTLLKGLKDVPAGAEQLMKDGVVLLICKDELNPIGEPASGMSFLLSLRLVHDKSGWHYLSPSDGRRSRIFRTFWEAAWAKDIVQLGLGSIDPVEMHRTLAFLFSDSHAYQLMVLARSNAQEARGKAMLLLKETVARYKDRVIRSKFCESDGYIVKGAIRNYFISMDSESVVTYPGNQDICIVDTDSRPNHRSDKIVSRILLLLNDGRLKSQVNTLESLGEGSFEELVVEDENTEGKYGEGKNTE